MSALDSFLKEKRAEISELKKERRKLKGNEKQKLDKPIEKLEVLVRQFMKSKMEPGRAGNIIINNKLYERFIKKLNGYEVQLNITDESLILQYGKVYGDWTGSLELYDISYHFEGHGEVRKEVDLTWMLM